jgi:hypothetical protein
MNPGVYNERGFQWLDRIINIVCILIFFEISDLRFLSLVLMGSTQFWTYTLRRVAKTSTGTLTLASTELYFGSTSSFRTERLHFGKSWQDGTRATLGYVRLITRRIG